MKTKRSVLSALLAGAMVFSLAGCTGAASSPGTAAATAAPTAEGVPQGRWVESTVVIPQGLSLFGSVALREDGSLLAFAENDAGETVRLTSADAGASWQAETLDWAARAGGSIARWAVRGDGTVAFFTYNYADEADPMSRFVRAWLAAPDGALTELALPDELQALYSVANLCFLADGTLVFTPLSYEETLPGDLLFYDVDSQQVKNWVAVGAAAGVSGVSAAPAILPAVDETGTAFLYFLNEKGDLCRAAPDGSAAVLTPNFAPDAYATQLCLAPDGALCYADGSGIYRQTPGGGLTEQVVDGVGTALSLESSYLVALHALADGSYLALVRSNLAEPTLYRYTFDETLAAATEQLEVWSLYENATARAAIQAFARVHPEYSVAYTAALRQDTPVTKDDALRTLNTELLAGEGPDVLILDDTDLEAFTASGLLADLSGAVDAGALLDCIAEDYVADDGAIPVLPGRFTIPVMAGAAGSLDGVATLDDVLALIQKYPARPAGASSDPLPDNEQYALGFSGLYEVAQFALQTSQPALLTETGLDEAALRELLSFIAGVGEAYGLETSGLSDVSYGIVISGDEADPVSWSNGMSDYGQFGRARFGWDSIATPAWLRATAPNGKAGGQVILQPGLCEGVYAPSCLAAVNAGSGETDAALDFVATLLSDEVQGRSQGDGLPVTETGLEETLARNEAVMERGAFTALLDGLSTPVAVDAALLSSLSTHAEAMVKGEETLDEAADGVQGDLALRFAERQ